MGRARLTLEDGTRVGADVLVVGLGVERRTGLAEAAGLAVDDGVLVDATFETGVHGSSPSATSPAVPTR